MVGSAPVDDGRGGQSDHSGKRALSLVTFTLALIFGLADQLILGNNMKTWREGLER